MKIAAGYHPGPVMPPTADGAPLKLWTLSSESQLFWYLIIAISALTQWSFSVSSLTRPETRSYSSKCSPSFWDTWCWWRLGCWAGPCRWRCRRALEGPRWRWGSRCQKSSPPPTGPISRDRGWPGSWTRSRGPMRSEPRPLRSESEK